MWHYVEGLRNWDPIWDNHGIRILPGPSSMWFDAAGRRLPAPYLPGFDTLGTLRHLRATGYDYSWFVLTQKIIEKEFALSGSEQNPDLTGKDVKLLLGRVVGDGAPGAGRGVQGARRGLRRRRRRSPSWCAGMNQVGGPDQGGAVIEEADAAPADRGARPADRQPLLQGHPGHVHPPAPRVPRRQAGPRRVRRTRSSTRRTAR